MIYAESNVENVYLKLEEKNKQTNSKETLEGERSN